jgi:hypothetical protein
VKSPKIVPKLDDLKRGSVRVADRDPAGRDEAMISAETKQVIERAKEIYADRLQHELEARHRDQFVAIEPESGEYFLGDTFDEAVRYARTKYPDRLTHTIRIGHRAAYHLGAMPG